MFLLLLLMMMLLLMLLLGGGGGGGGGMPQEPKYTVHRVFELSSSLIAPSPCSHVIREIISETKRSVSTNS